MKVRVPQSSFRINGTSNKVNPKIKCTTTALYIKKMFA